MVKKRLAPIIVVTGGTGSGKSTVTAVFKKLGARVIDVDRFAHRLLKPESFCWKAILKSFCGVQPIRSFQYGHRYKGDHFIDQNGQALPELPWIIRSDGNIRRDRLGATVFSDPKALSRLNKIVHPKLRKLLDAKIANHQKLTTKPLVLDMAVYPEKVFKGIGDVVVWVRAPGGLRAQRLADNRRLSLEEAGARIQIQWKEVEFKRSAHFTLPNLGSDMDVRKGAEKLWPKVLRYALDGGA